MMQVHIDAICASREGPTQYVLEKSLDVERVFDEKRLLKMLKDGWNIAGKYINGTGYESYRLVERVHICTFLAFAEKRFGVEVTEAPDVILLDFQEFYDSTCEPEGLNVGVTVWETATGNHSYIRFDNDKAQEIRELLLLHLFVKQDKGMLMGLLEKKLAMQK